MTKVLFFIAKDQPTVNEQSQIDAIKTQQFDLFVRNASANTLYGDTLPEDCDYVAGSVPSEYGAPEWPGSATGGAVVKDGDAITVGGATYTFTVVDGAITAIVVS